MNPLSDPSTLRGSVLSGVPPIPAPGEAQAVTPSDLAASEQRTGALMESLLGKPVEICGVRVRQFSMADYALLRRLKSHFVCTQAGEDNLIEALLLFLYVMDARRTVDVVAEEAFSTDYKDVLRTAVVEMSKRVPIDTDLEQLLKSVENFIADARKTRVEAEPDKSKRGNKKKPEPSPAGSSS